MDHDTIVGLCAGGTVSWMIAMGVCGINYSDSGHKRRWARWLLLSIFFGPIILPILLIWGGGLAAKLIFFWVQDLFGVAEVHPLQATKRLLVKDKVEQGTGQLSIAENVGGELSEVRKV